METSSNLGLTIYNYTDDGDVPVETWINSTATNMQKIDNINTTVDTTLTMSGIPADSKTVGDKFSKYMLISDYDPQGKKADIFDTISSSITSVAVFYILVTTALSSLSGQAVTVKAGSEVYTVTMPAALSVYVPVTKASTTYSATCGAYSGSVTTTSYFGIYTITLS